MGCKYVKDFDFGPAKTYVQGYARGGKVHEDVAMDKQIVKAAVHKHEKAQHPGKPLTKLKKGGPIVEKATGERYASRAEMMKHEAAESPRMQREEVTRKSVATRKGIPVASREPMLAMKCGGYAKKK